MVTSRPECDPKGRYNMIQAARILGVSKKTVRRWELNGFINFHTRLGVRSRYTSGAQIIKCWEDMYL
ncbi:MAG: MerR family transcriptional regulator [Alloprevotella sp.]